MDISGSRFGMWTAISPTTHQDRPAWICRCDCGTERAVRQAFLLEGRSTSCGCKRRDSIVAATKKHGLRGSPLYKVWNSIKERCRNPNNGAYKNYGGRGITLCDEWLYSFQSFYDWCMTNGYNVGLEIDRVNNNGNYEPENCRFVTPKQNGNNRRTNTLITVNGVTRTLSEWSDVSGINRATIKSRINNGWEESNWLVPSTKERKNA